MRKLDGICDEATEELLVAFQRFATDWFVVDGDSGTPKNTGNWNLGVGCVADAILDPQENKSLLDAIAHFKELACATK
jgi:hypothetical protein